MANNATLLKVNDLTIEPSEKTPGVVVSKGELLFHGRSIINDPKVFFEPVLSWIKTYLRNPAETTIVTIKLEYIDAKSTQALFQILQILLELEKKGFVLLVKWYYSFGDIEMLELGEVIQGRLSIDMEFKEYAEDNSGF